MLYLAVLTDICSRVGDVYLERYKDRAKDHFLRSIASMITAGEFTDNDIRGYVKLKDDLSFSTHPYDASALNIFKIMTVMPDPQIPNNYSAFLKEFEDLKMLSQFEALRPEKEEIFIYQIGVNIYVVYRIAPGAESLKETDFATHAKWDDVNDFDSESGNAAFVWSANQTSTLTQIQANLLIAGIGSKWYKFTYTIDETTPFDGDGVATITTAFSLVAKKLNLSPGTHTVYFMSAVAPTDFVISIVSGSDTKGTFTFDDVSLKRMVDDSNFNPDSDVLFMKYVEDINGTAWTDSTDLKASPIYMSDNFIRRGIAMATKTLLDEVNV